MLALTTEVSSSSGKLQGLHCLAVAYLGTGMNWPTSVAHPSSVHDAFQIEGLQLLEFQGCG